MSLKRFTFFLVLFMTVFSIYFLSFASELYNNLKILVNADGKKSYGFYVHQSGLLVTDHDISGNFVELKISQSLSVTEKALVVKKLPLQGFSLLAAEPTSRSLYPLGDSDSVDIGDKIYIPGSYKGKIVSKRNNLDDYHYPCFTTTLPAKRENIGKPVLDINNKIIGLYISFRNKHLIVPINRVKPLIKQHNQVKKLFSFPGEESEDNSNPKAILTKGYPVVDKSISWKNNLLPLNQYGGNTDFSFGHIKDMAFDHKNNLYIIDSVYNEIKKISLSSVLKETSIAAWTLEDPNSDSKVPVDPIGSDNTDSSGGNPSAEKGIQPVDSDETEAQKVKTKKELPPPPSHTITVDLNRPVSVTVSYAGLIYVLDHGLEEIIIFNEDLKVVHRFNYRKIAGHFNPVLIRAFGDKIYAITDTDRLYRLSFRKSTEEFIASNIKFLHDRWLTANLIDFDYHKDHFYWLDNKKKLIRVMTKEQNISKSLELNVDTPRSIAAHNEELYVLDKLSGTIHVLQPDGTLKGTLKGSVENASGSPSLIKVSSKGILAIAYNNLSHIRLYRTSGELIKVLSNHSSKDKRFSSPISITVNQDKTPVAVSEDSLIHNITASGSLNGDGSGNTLLPEEKTSLRGIVASPTGDIFFTDTQNDRLLIKPAKPNS
ncbi:MAG: hypothetical protein OEZ36_13910, partial [Spirochaetota bacterium]|nr:hypothetical protein [Spirochaetota bacterium]